MATKSPIYQVFSVEKDFPFIASISGKLGDVVYRTPKRGKTYVSKAPGKRKKKPSQAQRRQQEHFTMANEYASQAKDEPVYMELAEKTGRSASRIAFCDWWHGPVIHEVSRRARCIRIDASDNMHVARVHVTITGEEGKTIEGGDAVRTFGDAWWEFETRTAGKVLVEVWDPAGSVSRRARFQVSTIR